MNALKSLAVATAFFLFVCAGAGAQEDAAPFGLKWMVSSDDITALGVELTPVELPGFGDSFTAAKLPKALSDIETVVLSFGYNDQLWRVAAISSDFENDKYGSRAKARFSELDTSLSKSYKTGESFQRTPTDSYFSEPENFAYALSQNEAFWYSTYSSPVATIELSLDSNHYDTFWRLIYSHIAGEKEFEAGKSDAELDAL